MNKVLVGLVAVLIIAVAGLFVKIFTADEKVAYIDTGKLLENSNDMKTMKEQMKSEVDKAKANIDTLTKEFESSLKQYEKDLGKMSAKEKELSKQLLENKRMQLIQYQQAVEQKVGQQEEKLRQEVLNKINKDIAQYGKEHNYKLIFATSGGNIAYGSVDVDITEEVIKVINN